MTTIRLKILQRIFLVVKFCNMRPLGSNKKNNFNKFKLPDYFYSGRYFRIFYFKLRKIITLARPMINFIKTCHEMNFMSKNTKFIIQNLNVFGAVMNSWAYCFQNIEFLVFKGRVFINHEILAF